MSPKPLSRRHLLRGTGVSIGLPWLGAMTGSASAATRGADSAAPLDRPPVRSAFLFMPNGVNPANWTPATIEGSDRFELTPMLRPLAGVRDEVVLLENFHHPNLGQGNGHWPKVPAFLSGGHVLRTSGRDLDTGNTSVPNEIVPQLAFDRLFRGVSAPPVSGIDGDSALDHCMVMFGSTLRDGNKHDTENLPLLFFGGGGGDIRRGRRLTAPEPTPLCNLYLAMMHRMGVRDDSFSTSTGPLDLT